MALRKLTPPPDRDRSHLILSYRQTSDGTWYLEWRQTVQSRKPVAIRKAWDTEIELINRIKALEARLVDQSAPRPVADLNLKPFDPTRYGRLNPANPSSAPAPQLRPQAPRELERQCPPDASAVGRPAHPRGTDGGDGSGR